MKQLPKDHPLRAKIASAEGRAKQNTANAAKLAKKRAAINSPVKQGVAFSSKL